MHWYWSFRYILVDNNIEIHGIHLLPQSFKLTRHCCEIPGEFARLWGGVDWFCSWPNPCHW